MNVSSLKEKIAEAISKHVSIEDTYTYDLKRTKSAFEVGTMSLEDFEEWTDENVEDLAETIVDALQPQLNENQQIVLDYLKDKCNLYSFIAYKPFEAIIRLSMLDPGKTELRVKNTIDELTYVQQSQVLEVFSRWALEQEEE